MVSTSTFIGISQKWSFRPDLSVASNLGLKCSGVTFPHRDMRRPKFIPEKKRIRQKNSNREIVRTVRRALEFRSALREDRGCWVAGRLGTESSRRGLDRAATGPDMSGCSRLVTGGDWRTRQAKSPLGSGEAPGPHAPRSSGPSAATPLTQLPFGSPAASRPVAPAEFGHGSPMCWFELGRDSSPRHGQRL